MIVMNIYDDNDDDRGIMAATVHRDRLHGEAPISTFHSDSSKGDFIAMTKDRLDGNMSSEEPTS